MSRQTGPRLRRMRALGADLPGLSRKSINNRPYPPGQHGNSRRRKDSEYKKQLVEKQKVRFNYGVHERQLRNLMIQRQESGNFDSIGRLHLISERFVIRALDRHGRSAPRRQSRDLEVPRPNAVSPGGSTLA